MENGKRMIRISKFMHLTDRCYAEFGSRETALDAEAIRAKARQEMESKDAEAKTETAM
jgi:hypothetical protein